MCSAKLLNHVEFWAKIVNANELGRIFDFTQYGPGRRHCLRPPMAIFSNFNKLSNVLNLHIAELQHLRLQLFFRMTICHCLQNIVPTSHQYKYKNQFGQFHDKISNTGFPIYGCPEKGSSLRLNFSSVSTNSVHCPTL